MDRGQGEAVIVLGLLLWVSWAVGPWWLGVIILLLALLVNLGEEVRQQGRKRGPQE